MVLCFFLNNRTGFICYLDAMFATENTLFASALHHIPKPASRRNSFDASGESVIRLSPIRLINHSPLSEGHTPSDFFSINY